MLWEATWFTGTKAVITALIGIYCVGAAAVGFIDRGLNLAVRAILVGAGLLLLYSQLTTDLIGLAIAVAVFAWQWWTGPRERRRTAAAPA